MHGGGVGRVNKRVVLLFLDRERKNKTKQFPSALPHLHESGERKLYDLILHWGSFIISGCFYYGLYKVVTNLISHYSFSISYIKTNAVKSTGSSSLSSDCTCRTRYAKRSFSNCLMVAHKETLGPA